MSVAYRPFLTLGLLALALLPTLAVSPPCQAQVMVSVGDSVGERGLISTRGFDAYCRILALDDAQRAAARDLMEGAAAANRAAADELRASMKAMSEKMGEAKKDGFEAIQKMLSEDMPAITEKYSSKRSALEKQFFDDLQGLLTPQQASKFPAVERHRRRETGLRGGPMAGGSPDLIDLLDTLKIDASKGELSEAVARYEAEVDRLLIDRDRLAKEQEGELRKRMKAFDPEGIENAQKPMRDNEAATREVTRLSAKKIADLVPANRKAEFEAAFRRREFPRVYKDPYLTKALDAAMAFSDLDAPQKQSLQDLKAQYQREAAPLNDAWAKAIEANRGGGMMRVVVREGGIPEPDGQQPIDDARKARTNLDETFEKRLGGILRDEQRSRLPQRRPEKPGRGLMDDDEEGGAGAMTISVQAVSHGEPLDVTEPDDAEKKDKK